MTKKIIKILLMILVLAPGVSEGASKYMPISDTRAVSFESFPIPHFPDWIFLSRISIGQRTVPDIYGHDFINLYMVENDADKLCNFFGKRSLVQRSVVLVDKSKSESNDPDYEANLFDLGGPQAYKKIKAQKRVAGFICSNKKNEKIKSYQFITNAGAVFRKVKRSGFGEAWQTPEGDIWSDVLAEDISLEKAELLCRSLGARLPTFSDFSNLLKFMKVPSQSDFIPQVLPHFGFNSPKNVLWSDSYNSNQFGYNLSNTFSPVCDKLMDCNEGIASVQYPYNTATKGALRCVGNQ